MRFHLVRWLPQCISRRIDRKSTRLNSSHGYISYAVFCLKKKNDQVAQALPPHRIARALLDLGKLAGDVMGPAGRVARMLAGPRGADQAERCRVHAFAVCA